MSMELKWNKTDGKTEVLAEKHVVVAVCQSQIPHGLTSDRTRATGDQPSEPWNVQRRNVRTA